MTITKYKSESNRDFLATTSTKEKLAIKEIIDRISALPANGDLMISWGPKTKYTTISFLCSNKTSQNIEIYDGKFKTPSTGFIAESNPAEEKLALDIESLVAPAIDIKIPKITNYPVQFKDFTIKYTGTKHTPQPANGPTVGPTNENYFSIWENGSADQVTLSIFDGQIPPQPKAFVVGKTTYYLLTYQGTKGESLYSSHFMISNKSPRR